MIHWGTVSLLASLRGVSVGGVTGQQEEKAMPLLVDFHGLLEPQNTSRSVNMWFCVLASKYK